MCFVRTQAATAEAANKRRENLVKAKEGLDALVAGLEERLRAAVADATAARAAAAGWAEEAARLAAQLAAPGQGHGHGQRQGQGSSAPAVAGSGHAGSPP